MANEKSNASIGFEKQIWDAACVLWGHIPAADYRKVIVGLIFLRYVSCAFDKRYKTLVEEGDGFENDKDAYTAENVFFVPESARWNVVASAAHTPEIGKVIDDAMRAIEVENPALKNVLPKNYNSPDLDKRVLGEVVDLFTNNIRMDDVDQGRDLLGRTYEYCIAQFAAYEGVKGGEFYTPASIVKTIVAILKPFENCRVYDPCCGSGGMFVQSVKFLQAHSGNRSGISVFGQESNADTWKMAKMNMAIRGIDADLGPYNRDTFFDDLHPTLKADFIMANPPFNLSNWGQDKLKDDKRWKYGTPPAGNANFAWIQHMIHHLAPRGKIGLVLANGAFSSQSSGEGEIRKNIIEDDLIEGIVALPTQLFYSVTIPVTLWFITKGKKQPGKTVFIDARKMGHMVDRKHRDFSDEDIQKIADTFEAFQNGTLEDVKGFCAVKTTADIAAQDYILTPGRYVGIEEQEDDGEPFEEKMTRLTSELSEMFKKSHELEDEIRKKLGRLGMKYNEVCLADVCDLIAGYAFKSKDFGDFDDKVIKITHITPPIVDMNGLSGVDFSKYNREKLKRYIAKSGDYVLAMTGATIGKIGRIVSGEAYINQRVLLFKNKDAIDKDFLYYVLLQHDFEQYVYNHIDSESAQPNISATTIGKYIFSLPPMSIQQKIGRLLRSLDEKCEVNNAINHNLEQQAQALYHQMFCSTPHPDWRNGVLSDIADIVMGQSPDGKSYNEDGIGTVFYQGRAEFGTRFPTQRLFTTEPKRMAQENDVLISVRAPVGDLNVAKEDCCIGRGLGAVRSKDRHQSFVLYTMFALRSQLNVFNGEGTVFGSINRDSLNSMPVIIPPITAINKFEELVAPMDKAIRTDHDEICHLQSLRDALLPRLMSGEVDVSEIEF